MIVASVKETDSLESLSIYLLHALRICHALFFVRRDHSCLRSSPVDLRFSGLVRRNGLEDVLLTILYVLPRDMANALGLLWLANPSKTLTGFILAVGSTAILL